MAHAWWETIDFVQSAKYAAPGPELLFQKGRYHFYDKSPSEDGYRFIWRANGRLQSRPARIDDLQEIDALIRAGRSKGWM